MYRDSAGFIAHQYTPTCQSIVAAGLTPGEATWLPHTSYFRNILALRLFQVWISYTVPYTLWTHYNKYSNLKSQNDWLYTKVSICVQRRIKDNSVSIVSKKTNDEILRNIITNKRTVSRKSAWLYSSKLFLIYEDKLPKLCSFSTVLTTSACKGE